jgi:RHS repeat-associated protein
LWQGREYSYKTGLYYFRARWYDPVMGRWLSNDPIGISGGLNQYVFCANNPVNFRDPLGLIYYSNYISDGNQQYGFNGNSFVQFDTSGHAIGQASIQAGQAIVVYGGIGMAVSGATLGGAVLAAEAAPYVIVGGAAVMTAGQSALWRLMMWQPFQGLINTTSLQGSYQNAQTVTGPSSTYLTFGQMASMYGPQFLSGIMPGPGGPFGNMSEARAWGAGWVISGGPQATLESYRNHPCPDGK